MLIEDDLYPTRGEQERLTERKDPILYGWDHPNKALNESQLTGYQDRGFVVVPGVLSSFEVECLNAELSGLKRRNNLERHHYWRQCVPPGESESLFAPERTSPLFRRLAREHRILDPVMQILGGPVCLHRSRIHIEDGVNGASYPWHSEFETWHAEDGVPRMRGAEAWILLTRSTPENGALRMIAKSHYIYAACLGDKVFDAANPASMRGLARPSFETLTRLRYFGELMRACGEPGTLVICDSNLMYGSTRGVKGRPQAQAMFSYNSMENLPAAQPFASRDFRPSPIVNREFAALMPEALDCERVYEQRDSFRRPPRTQSHAYRNRMRVGGGARPQL